jgi:phage-related protein
VKWEIVYYSEKVRLTVEAWPVGIRASYARITEMMQTYGPVLGLPYTRHMGGGLIEIRARGAQGIGRAFFCTIKGNKIIILHAFIKKTDRTPMREMETARKRLIEVLHEDT